LNTTERAALRTKLGLAEEQPVLLFVGRFVAKKGLPLLMDLVPRLPHVQWVFAGRGPLDPGGWEQPAVRVFRDRAGPTLAELYQVADLLVLPSVGEGFPLVVQEAMACGTPVLAGNELVGALPDVDRVLLTEPVEGAEALDRWQARLATISADPDSLRQRRQAVAEFASECWSWHRCADSYLDLYRKTMNP
jgi:glycosyltransferase involved in cell wall biosynthesis